jgi:transposase
MPIDAAARAQLVTRFEVLLPHLNERQQRLAVGTEARLLGHGGVRAVADAAKVSASTVRRGVAELESGEDPGPVGRVRRAGGGRKRAADHDPDLVAALLRLVEPDERGDPMSALRWTTKSLRHLAEELTGQGHPVSAPTVGVLLRENGFSLQGTAKTISPRLRPPQRHSTHPGLVKQPRTSPAQPHRQPPAQHGPAPNSDHPGALPPTSPRVPATPPRRR